MRLGYLMLPPVLVPVYQQATRLADRHAPVLEPRVLVALIDDRAYERRMRRQNERHRAALVAAARRVGLGLNPLSPLYARRALTRVRRVLYWAVPA